MAALVVFLKGINVGGHKRFRPSVLAAQLKRWDVVNIGAAGTFVFRDPPSRAELRAAIRRRLPFEAEIVICAGREVSRMVAKDPLGATHEDDLLSRVDRSALRSARDHAQLGTLTAIDDVLRAS